MMGVFLRLVLLVALAAASACGLNSNSSGRDGADADEAGPVSGSVDVQAQPFRLGLKTGGTPLAELSGPVRLVWADGREDELVTLLAQHSDGGTTTYDVETQAGQVATVAVSVSDDASFRISIGGVAAAAVSVGLRLEEGELIYGLTERLRDSPVLNAPTNGPLLEDFNPDAVSSLNRRGEIVEMFVRPTISLYAPFYQSSRGYGLWVEGTNPGVFDVGASDREELRFRMETGSAQNLTFDLFPGPRYQQILQRYFQRVGFPIRVPDWAFRHWLWRDELSTGVTAKLDGNAVNAEIATDVMMYEQYSIPPGIYLFDRPYLVGAQDPESEGFHTFAWDAERLPNIESTLESLRARGFRIAVWSAAWARNNGPGSNGAEAASLGYLAPGNSRVIDLTNPDAQAWWREKLEAFLKQFSISAIKLDRGEEYVPSTAADIYSDGRSGREVHNAFPVLQAKVHHDALRSATDNDFVLIARAGYSGSQQWAASWGGDDVGTELGLRSAIVKLQRAGFIGFPTWGSDTGGYYPFRQREVFARWLQFSALTPIMEIGGIGSHAPWAMPTDPAFDEEMIAIYARYVKLHHDLIPYTAAQADLASSQGLPIARAMVFDFPDDPRFADSWDQYMYGPDLLVAPIWQVGSRERQVLVPAGTWRLFWDPNQSWTGPATITSGSAAGYVAPAGAGRRPTGALTRFIWPAGRRCAGDVHFTKCEASTKVR
ncbi:MAG: glycoside hydrolase family 31 protein [Halioglobus sp.]